MSALGTPTMQDLIGRSLGHYRIVERLADEAYLEDVAMSERKRASGLRNPASSSATPGLFGPAGGRTE